MKITNIDNFKMGWFVGDFDPVIIKTKDFELGYKQYKSGDHPEKHTHKVATEYTIVVNGVVSMNDEIFKAKDIIIMEPNDIADFKVIEDADVMVIKIPSVRNDKYLIEE